MKTTTRSQLKGYGVSQYHAFIITKTLIPIDKKNRINIYALEEVINSFKNYLQRPRIKPKTRHLFELVLERLFKQLGNLRKIPFIEATDPNLSQLSKRLYHTLIKTENYFTEMGVVGTTIKDKKS